MAAILPFVAPALSAAQGLTTALGMGLALSPAIEFVRNYAGRLKGSSRMSMFGGTDFTNSILTTPARLLVSLGGILQEPDPTSSTGFNITGSGPVNIVFAEAPEAGQTFFGIAFGVTTSAPLTNVTSEEEAIAYAIVLG